jgi:hypothetical protein
MTSFLPQKKRGLACPRLLELIEENPLYEASASGEEISSLTGVISGCGLIISGP